MKTECIRIVVVLAIVLSGIRPAASANQSLNLCYPERYWYPFLYTQDGAHKGLLHDIVRKACENLEIPLLIQTVPIRRAIHYAQAGNTDGVIVGFRDAWTQTLDYPPGVGDEKESPWRIMQVDEVVVSFAEDSYEFEGDLKTLPLPVRVLRDAPIIDELRRAGKSVEEVKEDVQNFLKLLRDKEGVIITSTVIAEMMARDPRFSERIKIHATPVASDSYYLAFSKKSSLSAEEKQRIWEEIVRWRDDYIFMLQVFSQY